MHWLWGSFSKRLSFCLLLCSGRNTGLFWRITAWDTTRTRLQKRWLHCFSFLHLSVGKLFLFPRWPFSFCRLPTWMVRLTCRPAAMWQSTRHNATTASKYMLVTVASRQVCFEHFWILPASLCNKNLACSVNWTLCFLWGQITLVCWNTISKYARNGTCGDFIPIFSQINVSCIKIRCTKLSFHCIDVCFQCCFWLFRPKKEFTLYRPWQQEYGGTGYRLSWRTSDPPQPPMWQGQHFRTHVFWLNYKQQSDMRSLTHTWGRHVEVPEGLSGVVQVMYTSQLCVCENNS